MAPGCYPGKGSPSRVRVSLAPLVPHIYFLAIPCVLWGAWANLGWSGLFYVAWALVVGFCCGALFELRATKKLLDACYEARARDRAEMEHEVNKFCREVAAATGATTNAPSIH